MADPLAGHVGPRMRQFFRLGANARSAYATIIASALFFFAGMQVMIAHGAWLTAEYGLGPVRLGTVALVLGLSDLCGSGLVSLATDRLGKRRSVLLGSISALIGFMLMPFLNVGVVMAVVGIAVARFGFEFAIVSNISLLSEQVPQQRGKVMTLGAAANLTAATLAGITGPGLYTLYGVWGLSLVSALMAAISIAIVTSRVREME
jgi:predicted MFS family arabinose efflux permease